MKRIVLLLAVLFAVTTTFSQLYETFDPPPTGWILSQGANFQAISSNGGVLTPGVGGNNPAVLGTPLVLKTSNTFQVCMLVYAYTSNLNSQVPFPCNTYVDVLFVKSTVTSSNDASNPANILARIDNTLLPTAGGNICFNFTFPSTVTDPSFKVFLSFHSDCNQSGVKYFVDNISLSGVSLVCGGTNCPPTATNDNFNRPSNELTFNAVVYGSPIDVSFPALPVGFAVCTTGTDTDPNDTYTHLKWILVTPPSNGTVILNPDGTTSITRNSLSVTQLVYTYKMSDDGPDDNFATTGDNMESNVATVTVNWPASSVTPVTLVYFSGSRNKSTVNLKWETLSESNNTGFEVMRSINNGAYETVAFVKTKATNGNSSTRISYDYSEVNNSKTTTLYRLKQIDLDGKASLTPVKSVKGEGMQSSVLVYPTPSTTGDVAVSVSGINSYNMYLVDMKGSIIRQWSKTSTDYVKIYDLQSGMYMLKLVDLSTGEQTSEKIIVNRR